MREKYKNARNIDERRFDNRVSVEHDVVAFFNDERYETKMRNLSGNGMQIVHPDDIEVQIRQDCHVLLRGDGKELKLSAQVIWIEYGLIGLRFEKLSPKTQKQLNSLANQFLSTITKGSPRLV